MKIAYLFENDICNSFFRLGQDDAQQGECNVREQYDRV